MGIKFSYPKEWNVVDESSKIATLFRLQSPDYKEIKDNNNSSVGYTGTVITVMAARIAFTYDEDRASVTDPNNRPQSTNIQDFTLKGRRAFSYTNEPYGGAGQTFTVEIDIKDKTPVKFIFQPSNAKEQYDETYKSVFDTIINSVEYL
ncbi:MAG: hypothetical protein JWP13_36 [Candidatus Saccharibacteria bacterium]|nr:hypothetical protein [Candidatus Saccharibacteria bacterium]